MVLTFRSAVTAGLCVSLSAAAVCASALVSADAELPVVRIVRTTTPAVIDGRPDEAAWAAAAVIGDFHQSRPLDHGAPSQRTEIRLMYDDNALYIAGRFFESDPREISANIATSSCKTPTRSSSAISAGTTTVPAEPIPPRIARARRMRDPLVRQDEFGTLPASDAFVGRATANVLGESSVGVMVGRRSELRARQLAVRRRFPLSQHEAPGRRRARGRGVVPALEHRRSQRR